MIRLRSGLLKTGPGGPSDAGRRVDRQSRPRRLSEQPVKCEGAERGDGEAVEAADREDPCIVMRIQRGALIGTRSANDIMARGQQHRNLRGRTHDRTRPHRQAKTLFPLHRSGRPHMTTPVLALQKPRLIPPTPRVALVGKQAPPTRPASSLIGALRAARGSLPFATCTTHSRGQL